MITEELVIAAQKAWGDGIVRIAAAHTNGEDFEQAAKDHINDLYNYGASNVLFKPTLAADDLVRGTFGETLSYFVTDNGVCGEDSGFAIKGWTAVRLRTPRCSRQHRHGDGELLLHRPRG